MFYQDSFNGGVTTGGYSPAHSGFGNNTIVVNIAAGSTIRQAYLLAGRCGNALPVTVQLNGNNLTFNTTNQITGGFLTLYGGASGVHAIDVTGLISPTNNNYNLSIPTQSGTSNRYQDFYLYIAYDNNTMATVNTAIVLNTTNLNVSSYTYNYTLANPIDTNFDVGLSLFTGYACNTNADGENVTVNGTNIGLYGGPDLGSGICGGPIGSFYFNNGTLTQLADDNANQAIAGADNLSNIQTLVPNNSTSMNVGFSHQSGGSDNHVWGVIMAYGGQCVPPIADAGPDTTICLGAGTFLTASGGSDYLWSPSVGLLDSTAATTFASPSVTTTYTVVVSNGSCSDTDTVVVFVDPTPPPVMTITGDSVICTGDSTTLNVSGATTYIWSADTGVIDTSAVITLNPDTTTTYYVLGISTICASLPDSFTIDVQPPPTATISGAPSMCLGDSTTLYASGGLTYQWSGGITSTADSVTVGPLVPTTYYLTTDNGICISPPDTFVVTPTALPTVSIAGPDTICAGDLVAITASGGTSYQWSGGSTATTATINVSPIINNWYTAVAFDGVCYSPPDSHLVSVIQIPTVNVTGNSQICEGNSTVLTAIGSINYQWSGGSTATTGTITVSPNTTTTYSVTTDNGTCTSDPDSITVTVIPTPVVTLSGPDTICRGDVVTLSAVGGASYQWGGAGTGNTSNLVVGPFNTALYTVTAFISGCPSLPDSHTVEVLPLPIAIISGELEICEGESTTLAAPSGSGYQWSGGGVNSTNSQITVNPAQTTTYYLQVANQYCQSDPDTATVVVHPVPEPEIIGPNDICRDDEVTLTATGGLSYTWRGGSNAQTASIQIKPLGTTSYVVFADNGYCEAWSDSFTVTVTNPPFLEVTGDSVICLGQSTVLEADVTNGSYLWSTGDTTRRMIIETINDGPVDPITSEIYWVSATNFCGVSSDTMRVYFEDCQCLVWVPNAFTPDGDSDNDIFNPVFDCNVVEYRLRIFDRWGKLLFETQDLNEGWNGRHKGTISQIGSYVWMLEYKGDQHSRTVAKRKHGVVHLVR